MHHSMGDGYVPDAAWNSMVVLVDRIRGFGTACCCADARVSAHPRIDSCVVRRLIMEGGQCLCNGSIPLFRKFAYGTADSKNRSMF